MARRTPKRITTRDVAVRAGVSQPTVSLVLGNNASARVAPETRARVLRAAAELGYRPNVLARGLVRRRSYALGIIVPDLSNPFFADVISGAERVAAERGYALLLCDAAEVSRERHIETLQSRLIDGIMMDAGAASLPNGALDGTNVVIIDEPGARWPGVATDAFGAGRLAATHLIELGHRLIGFLGPASDTHASRLRERGFAHALREARLPLESALLRRVAPTAAGGRAGMRALLALRPRPTAVFAVNDLVAIGALKACATAGVAVPSEMSLVGCDDIELARLVTPELTTIAVPARELGARAARLLIRRIEESATSGEAGAAVDRASTARADIQAEARLQRPLPTRLVARGTSAPPPGALTDGASLPGGSRP